MKISVIGAGNVGSLTAMRIAHDGLGEIILLDVVTGLARGKALDMDDARAIIKQNYNIQGTQEISDIAGSDIVVITAGLPRKPGMTREELLSKNSGILKGICQKVKELSPQAIVIVVTNPLDLMTFFALKVLGFNSSKVLGMGPSLDAARFANAISGISGVAAEDIEAVVIGSHGEGMLPLPRLTTIKGISLLEFLDDKKTALAVKNTILRGQEIVSLLGSGSAFFAPSAAIAYLVKAIARDEKRIVGACAYLNGEYGLKDICIGVPCRLGKNGIEKIIELDLDQEEKAAFYKSAQNIHNLCQQLTQ
ncbi:MAG: malate dehydrogenase [Candidatus Omnitrophota bacterium]